MITVVCPKCKRENTMCVCMSNAECYVPILGIQDQRVPHVFHMPIGTQVPLARERH